MFYNLNQYPDRPEAAHILEHMFLSFSCLQKKQVESFLWPYIETSIEDDSNPRAIETLNLKEIKNIQTVNSHGEIVIVQHSFIQTWETNFYFCVATQDTNYQLCGLGSLNNLIPNNENEDYQHEVMQLLDLTVIPWLKLIKF